MSVSFAYFIYIRVMGSSGLYIHIPFCRNKCLYCDFYSGGSRIADWNLFIDSLISEIHARKKELTEIPSTIYIGGGTPSLIPDKHLIKLISQIRNTFEISSPVSEFTLEANPEDITEERCRLWKSSGINRLSLGVQSLNDNELKAIGRRHNAEMALKAIDMASKYFENISADIMFGLPFQTVESYEKTLQQMVQCTLTHLSSYSLMLEDGTAMTLLVEKDKIKLPNEKEWEMMYEMTNEIPESFGFQRYEISNYAKEGFESIHNQGYWNGIEYLGIGPGAHSYNGKDVRRANPCDLKGYIKYFSEEDSIVLNRNASEPFYREEILSSEEKKEEMIMCRLRMAKGLDLKEFHSKFGAKETQAIINKCEMFVKSGYLKIEKDLLFFTKKGFAISDSIMTDLI